MEIDRWSLVLSTLPIFNFWLFISMIIILILSAFFSIAETAFSSANQVRLRLMVENGNKEAKKALYYTENYNSTLTTCLVGNNIANIALATISVGFFAKLMGNENAAGVVSTIVCTIAVLTFAEILPKTIAKKMPETIVIKLASLFQVISYILLPISFMFSLIQKIGRQNEEHGVNEEELEEILDSMEQAGNIDAEEVTMIQNILVLNDRSVKDIMTPRIDIIAIDVESTIDEIKELLYETQYSRLPVYKEDKDHILGIIYEREFLTKLNQGVEFDITDLIRDAIFVSETMKVNSLIHELQKKKVHIAIVIGEYGETAGIVTMEDALEELVGEIYDEHDKSSDDVLIKRVSDSEFIVNGEIYLEDLFDDLEIGKAPKSPYSKLAGFIYAKAKDVPRVGFTYNYVTHFIRRTADDDYEEISKKLIFSVDEVNDRRITKVRLIIEEFEEDQSE